MLKLQNILILFGLLTFLGCASYNPGNYAKVKGGNHPVNTPINAEITSQLSSEPFVYVNFTFGNRNKDKWTRVKSVRVTNISDEKDARMIVGADLIAWSEGMTRKATIDAYNRQVALGVTAGLLAAGAAVSAKNNPDLSIGLAGGALATAGIADINNMIDRIDFLELAALVPRTHLYSPFSIPPDLYIAKWAVFEMPRGASLRFVEFEVTYLSGKKAHYTVKLDGSTRKRKR